MKFKGLLLIIPALLLASCDKAPVENLSVIGSFLKKSKLGFTLKGEQVLNTYSDATNELVFKEKDNYDIRSDDRNGNKRSFTTYEKVDNTISPATYTYIKGKEGLVNKEYIDYKNEVNSYTVFGSFVYDEIYMNPFLFLYEDDFIQDQEDLNKYHLVDTKKEKFNTLLSYTGAPSKDVSFIFNEEELDHVEVMSVDLHGKYLVPEENVYIQATWNFKQNMILSKLGETTVESPKVSETKENKELSSFINNIKDNYTIDLKLGLRGINGQIVSNQLIYNTKDKIYFDLDAKLNEPQNDILYQYDKFDREDKHLYEYKLNEATNDWKKTLNDTQDAYNVSPLLREDFNLRINDLNVSLFDKDTDGKYIVNNKEAKSNIGEAFFSKAIDAPYYQLGLGVDCVLTLSNNEINAYLPVDIISDSGFIEAYYSVTIKDIGNTTLPIEL